MATLVELTTLITAWGEARGIVANSDPFAQACKTHEEVCELLEADASIRALDAIGAFTGDYKDELKDAIGDVYVTLVMVCACNKTLMTGNEYDRSLLPEKVSPIKDLLSCMAYLFHACALADVTNHASHVYSEALTMEESLRTVCEYHKLNFTDCVAQAYSEIKDRKGYLRPDGVFVKEESCQ